MGNAGYAGSWVAATVILCQLLPAGSMGGSQVHSAQKRHLTFLDGAFGTFQLNNLPNSTREALHRLHSHPYIHPTHRLRFGTTSNSSEELPFESEPGPEIELQPLP
eukprot:scaffold681598_cov43-Prasinocladus_malaysianus.AAC.1